MNSFRMFKNFGGSVRFGSLVTKIGEEEVNDFRKEKYRSLKCFFFFFGMSRKVLNF